ncbi:MAG: aldo/keto reductase [Chloroflexi bacterium]|nr:aldo/keto reductase [Chloroflexota bacterium]
MQYVRLGNTGLKVSRLCLGCMSYGTSQWRSWVLDEEPSRVFIKQALDLGINFFDTADMYAKGASEQVLGRAIRDFAKRDQVIITTKVFNRVGQGPNDAGLSRKHILDSIDGSLRRLGTDYVDIYMIHRWDYETPIEETLATLDDLVHAGKVRYIGASSMFAWQFAKALFTSDAHGWSRFVVMQNHYNLIYREEEREMIPLCRDQGIALTPWSPLARGFLAGNRTRDKKGETTRANDDPYAFELYYRNEDFVIAERVGQVAQQRGVKPLQIALAWMLNKPEITSPIIGATKPHHLPEAIAALDIKLTSDEIKSLEEPYVPHPILGHS